MKVNLIHSSSVYCTTKPYMDKNNTDEFCYPCIDNVGVNNNPTKIWWSSINKGIINEPKVIFGTFGDGVFIDYFGQFGITQHSSAIVDTPDNLPKIARALKHPNVLELMNSIDFGGITTVFNWKVIALFKHDFYNQFL